MEKIIPRAINYSDIKPEAIENMVRVVRFTPTATVNNALANDIIRFQLMGNGFYDPYSAYIRLEVKVNLDEFQPNDSQRFVGRFLDRSAHSFISRLVIKSQGTELERIEQYDVMAAMVNDMLYSQEQSILHHFEGFPTHSIDHSGVFADQFATDPNGCGNVPLLMLNSSSQDLTYRYLVDQGFWKYQVPVALSTEFVGVEQSASNPDEVDHFDETKNNIKVTATAGAVGYDLASRTNAYLVDHHKAFYSASGRSVTLASSSSATPNFTTALLDNTTVFHSPDSLVFCIPIYSGIIGVLMPDKKMLPLSLMPLEVEFTMNPYALYTVNGVVDLNPRAYTITKFWIYSHVLFFEQELHRSLEAVVAESGIFIHFNSFYLAPIATHVSDQVLNYAQINIHAKSINSVHFVFVYSGYERTLGHRKLHFVNHNLNFLQIRNGTELTPSEAIQGEQQTMKSSGHHIQFLLETFKAWNKMHDATSDAAISFFNYVTDEYLEYPDTFSRMITQQANLGRCQYAISLEGEELGQDKSIITGRKGLIPFDINMQSAKKSFTNTSFQFIFVKADYIIYVRPDLVVTLLGR